MNALQNGPATTVSRKYVQIRHSVSDSLIAEGPLGWGITPFEGNYYISSKYLLTDGFRVNWLPGILAGSTGCPIHCCRLYGLG